MHSRLGPAASPCRPVPVLAACEERRDGESEKSIRLRLYVFLRLICFPSRLRAGEKKRPNYFFAREKQASEQVWPIKVLSIAAIVQRARATAQARWAVAPPL